MAWAKKVLPHIPESVASIDDAWKSSIGGGTIYLIQDAHTNTSGQLNVAKMLDLILQKEPIRQVFLEAGYGNESLSFLRKYSHLKQREQAAKSYLMKGELQGVEYLDLTSNHDFTLWGVEDMSLYLKSLETYRSAAKQRQKFDDYLQKIESTIQTLKPRIYNPFLLSFDEKYRRFHNEEISLTEYFEILTQEAQKLGISLRLYPHLKVLKHLKVLESKIDFKTASEEQERAIASLSPKDREELAVVSGDNRSPLKLSTHEEEARKGFFALLEEKLGENTKTFPELSKYFRYLKKAKEVQAKSILEEQKKLEEEVFKALATTQDEIDLIQASRNTGALKKLLHLELTPDEFEEYQDKKQNLGIKKITGFLNKKIMDLKSRYDKAVFLEEGYEDTIRNCEEFYSLTYQRDQKFVQNLTDKMDKEDESKAVLITGGYHSPNLKTLLKQKGISYIVLTPQILQETNQKRYEELLLNQNLKEALATKESILPNVSKARTSSFTAAHIDLTREITYNAHGDRLAMLSDLSGKNFNSAAFESNRQRQYAPAGARLADDSEDSPDHSYFDESLGPNIRFYKAIESARKHALKALHLIDPTWNTAGRIAQIEVASRAQRDRLESIRHIDGLDRLAYHAYESELDLLGFLYYLDRTLEGWMGSGPGDLAGVKSETGFVNILNGSVFQLYMLYLDVQGDFGNKVPDFGDHNKDLSNSFREINIGLSTAAQLVHKIRLLPWLIENEGSNIVSLSVLNPEETAILPATLIQITDIDQIRSDDYKDYEIAFHRVARSMARQIQSELPPQARVDITGDTSLEEHLARWLAVHFLDGNRADAFLPIVFRWSLDQSHPESDRIILEWWHAPGDWVGVAESKLELKNLPYERIPSKLRKEALQFIDTRNLEGGSIREKVSGDPKATYTATPIGHWVRYSLPLMYSAARLAEFSEDRLMREIRAFYGESRFHDLKNYMMARNLLIRPKIKTLSPIPEDSLSDSIEAYLRLTSVQNSDIISNDPAGIDHSIRSLIPYEYYWPWAAALSLHGGAEAIRFLGADLDRKADQVHRLGDEVFNSEAEGSSNNHWSAAYQEILLESIFLASTHNEKDVEAKRAILMNAADSANYRSPHVKDLAATFLKHALKKSRSEHSIRSHKLLLLYGRARSQYWDYTATVLQDKTTMVRPATSAPPTGARLATANISIPNELVQSVDSERIHRLIGDLRHSDRQRRKQAAHELGEIGPAAEEAVWELCNLVRSHDGSYGDIYEGPSSEALKALVKIGPTVIPHLIWHLADETNPDRKPFASGLSEFGEKAQGAAPALISIIDRYQNENEWYRLTIVGTLIKVGKNYPGTLPKLIQIMKTDPDDRIRYAAIRGIQGILGFDSVEFFVQAMEKPQIQGEYKDGQYGENSIIELGLGAVPVLQKLRNGNAERERLVTHLIRRITLEHRADLLDFVGREPFKMEDPNNEPLRSLLTWSTGELEERWQDLQRLVKTHGNGPVLVDELTYLKNSFGERESDVWPRYVQLSESEAPELYPSISRSIRVLAPHISDKDELSHRWQDLRSLLKLGFKAFDLHEELALFIKAFGERGKALWPVYIRLAETTPPKLYPAISRSVSALAPYISDAAELSERWNDLITMENASESFSGFVSDSGLPLLMLMRYLGAEMDLRRMNSIDEKRKFFEEQWPRLVRIVRSSRSYYTAWVRDEWTAERILNLTPDDAAEIFARLNAFWLPWKFLNGAQESDRRINNDTFQGDYMPLLIKMELLLPGSIFHLRGLLESSQSPAVVRRYMDAKRDALKNKEVLKAFSGFISRMTDLPGRKFKPDIAAYSEVLNFIAIMESMGIGSLAATILNEWDVRTSDRTDRLKLSSLLIDRFNREIDKDFFKYLDIEPVEADPTRAPVWKIFYTPFFTRIGEAYQRIKRDKFHKLRRFQGLIRSTVLGQFWDFIENKDQANATGREIAAHNETVRSAIVSQGIDVQKWLGKEPEHRMEPQTFDYQPGQIALDDSVTDIRQVIDYTQRTLSLPLGIHNVDGLKGVLRHFGIGVIGDASHPVLVLDEATKRKRARNLVEAVSEALEPLQTLVSVWTESEIILGASPQIAETLGHFGERIDLALRKKKIAQESGPSSSGKVRSFMLRPILREPGHDLFIGDFTMCCLGMNSGTFPDAMVDRLIDEGMNVIEVIDQSTGFTMAAAWLFLAEDGSLVIQNLEIHSDYEIDSALKQKIGEEMIEYAAKFSEAIGSKRFYLGRPGHGKYFTGDSQIILKRYEHTLVPFGLQKIGGFLGERYYLDSAGKSHAYLVWQQAAARLAFGRDSIDESDKQFVRQAFEAIEQKYHETPDQEDYLARQFETERTLEIWDHFRFRTVSQIPNEENDFEEFMRNLKPGAAWIVHAQDWESAVLWVYLGITQFTDDEGYRHENWTFIPYVPPGKRLGTAGYTLENLPIFMPPDRSIVIPDFGLFDRIVRQGQSEMRRPSKPSISIPIHIETSFSEPITDWGTFEALVNDLAEKTEGIQEVVLPDGTILDLGERNLDLAQDLGSKLIEIISSERPDIELPFGIALEERGQIHRLILKPLDDLTAARLAKSFEETQQFIAKHASLRTRNISKNQIHKIISLDLRNKSFEGQLWTILSHNQLRGGQSGAEFKDLKDFLNSANIPLDTASLVNDSSEMGRILGEVGIHLQVPASKAPRFQFGQSEVWRTEVTVDQETRKLIHENILPAYTTFDGQIKPTKLEVIFDGRTPVSLSSHHLSYEDLPSQAKKTAEESFFEQFGKSQTSLERTIDLSIRFGRSKKKSPYLFTFHFTSDRRLQQRVTSFLIQTEHGQTKSGSNPQAILYGNISSLVPQGDVVRERSFDHHGQSFRVVASKIKGWVMKPNYSKDYTTYSLEPQKVEDGAEESLGILRIYAKTRFGSLEVGKIQYSEIAGMIENVNLYIRPEYRGKKLMAEVMKNDFYPVIPNGSAIRMEIGNIYTLRQLLETIFSDREAVEKFSSSSRELIGKLRGLLDTLIGVVESREELGIDDTDMRGQVGWAVLTIVANSMLNENYRFTPEQEKDTVLAKLLTYAGFQDIQLQPRLHQAGSQKIAELSYVAIKSDPPTLDSLLSAPSAARLANGESDQRLNPAKLKSPNPFAIYPGSGYDLKGIRQILDEFDGVQTLLLIDPEYGDRSRALEILPGFRDILFSAMIHEPLIVKHELAIGPEEVPSLYEGARYYLKGYFLDHDYQEKPIELVFYGDDYLTWVAPRLILEEHGGFGVSVANTSGIDYKMWSWHFREEGEGFYKKLISETRPQGLISLTNMHVPPDSVLKAHPLNVLHDSRQTESKSSFARLFRRRARLFNNAQRLNENEFVLLQKTTAARLASTQPTPSPETTFFANVAREVLSANSPKRKLALGPRIYSLERHDDQVIVEGLYDEPVVLSLEKYTLVGKAPSDFKDTALDITDQFLKLIEANKKGSLTNLITVPFVVYLSDSLMTGLPKADKAKLGNLLQHLSPQVIIVLEGSEGFKKLIDTLVRERGFKNRIVSELPQEYQDSQAIHYIAKDFYREDMKEAYPGNNHHWIALEDDTQPGQTGAFAFGAIDTLAQRVALGDFPGAYEIFRELQTPGLNTSEPSLQDFLDFLKGNKEKIDLFALKPILTRSLQEAYKLYQMEQITRRSA